MILNSSIPARIESRCSKRRRLGNKPKILILGHGEHGKGTLACLLEYTYSLRTASSSEVAFPYIYPALKHIVNYANENDAKADKMNQRLLWKELISLFNSPDKTTLSRLILEDHNIYDGMRDLEEFTASYYLFDAIIWVDASRRKPLDQSMQIDYDSQSMIYVNNNGPQERLVKVVPWLGKVLQLD